MSILFPFLFVVAAIITKKDLAWITAGASWLAVGIGDQAVQHDWTLHAYITGMVFVNFVVGLVAYHHWKKSYSNSLERIIVWLCALSVIAYSLPIAGLFDSANYALLVIQAVTLAAILFLPGQKDFGDDLARFAAGFFHIGRFRGHSHKRRGD